jgi:hypothetical protein
MSETKLPGSGGDLKPGSQSISPNHFTSNTAARVMELRKAGHDIVTHRRFDESIRGRRHNVAEYVLVIEPGVRHG